MGTNTDSGKWPLAILGGISLPVSTALANLVLDPTASLSPNFYPTLVGGFVTFLLSLGVFAGKKYSFQENAWHFASMGLAGFILVYWARYNSVLLSLMVEVILVIALAVSCFVLRKELAKRYGKRRIVAYAGLILVALLPVTAIIQNMGEQPLVVATPSPKYVMISQGGLSQDGNVTVESVYADAWNVKVTSQSPTYLLTAYLDGRENGPIDIPFLERGRTDSIWALKIDTSPQIENDTYSVILNCTYRDGLGRIFEDSTVITVYVGQMGASSIALIQQYMPIIVEILIYAFIVVSSHPK